MSDQRYDEAIDTPPCSCNKIKIINILKRLDKEELYEIIKEDGEVDVMCNFCNKHYIFNEHDLDQIFITTAIDTSEVN